MKKPLIFIFNVSLNQGIFLNLVKTAQIRHVFKKGDTYDTSNYRPILILSVFLKYILTDAQQGFRDNKSTDMASQIFTENIQESINKQLYVLGFFFWPH